MIFYVVLIPLGHVLKDFELGGDDVIPQDKRQDPQLPDEDHGIHVGFTGRYDCQDFCEGPHYKEVIEESL